MAHGCIGNSIVGNNGRDRVKNEILDLRDTRDLDEITEVDPNAVLQHSRPIHHFEKKWRRVYNRRICRYWDSIDSQIGCYSNLNIDTYKTTRSYLHVSSRSVNITVHVHCIELIGQPGRLLIMPFNVDRETIMLMMMMTTMVMAMAMTMTIVKTMTMMVKYAYSVSLSI